MVEGSLVVVDVGLDFQSCSRDSTVSHLARINRMKSLVGTSPRLGTELGPTNPDLKKTHFNSNRTTRSRLHDVPLMFDILKHFLNIRFNIYFTA